MSAPEIPIPLENFRIKNRYSGTEYTIADTQYLNRHESRMGEKIPRWMADVIISKPKLPEGVLFAVKHLGNRPEGSPPNPLMRDIVLSFFGNSSKTDMEKKNWCLDEYVKPNKQDPWEALTKIFPTGDLDKGLFTMSRGGVVQSDQEYIFHMLVNQVGFPGTAINKLLKAAIEAKIPMPLTLLRKYSLQTHKIFLQTYTIDESTGVMISLDPPPAKPVEIAATEKKAQTCSQAAQP